MKIIFACLVLTIISCKSYQVDGKTFETEKEMNKYLLEKKNEKILEENQNKRNLFLKEITDKAKSQDGIVFLQECFPRRVAVTEGLYTSFCSSEYSFNDRADYYRGYGHDPFISKNTKEINTFLESHFNSLEFPKLENRIEVEIVKYNANKELYENIRQKKYIVIESNYFDSKNISEYSLKSKSFQFLYHANDTNNRFNDKSLTGKYLNIPDIKISITPDLAEKISLDGYNYLILFAEIKEKSNANKKKLELQIIDWILLNEVSLFRIDSLKK